MLGGVGDIGTSITAAEVRDHLQQHPLTSSEVIGESSAAYHVVNDGDDEEVIARVAFGATAAAQGPLTSDHQHPSRALIEPDNEEEGEAASAMMEVVPVPAAAPPVGAASHLVRPSFVMAKPVSAIRPVPMRVVRPSPQRAAPHPSSEAQVEVDRDTQMIPINEDDDDDAAAVPATSMVAAAAAKRPPRMPAIEVLQQVTVPQQAAHDFYGAAHAHGYSGSDVHDAVLLSHEWHRKWTHQHETGHGYQESVDRDRGFRPQEAAGESLSAFAAMAATEGVFNGGSKNPRRESSSALVVYSTPSPPIDASSSSFYDRYAGAKNPSPEDTFAEPRKRVRSALSELHKQQQEQGLVHGPFLAAAPHLGWPTAATTATVLGEGGPLRPVALRIPRPSTLRPTGPNHRHHHQAYGPSWTELVPQDIFDEMILYQDHKQVSFTPGQGGGGGERGASHHKSSHRKHRHHSSPRALSPLTVTSSTGGSVVKGGAPAPNTAILINEPNRVVHIIEPDAHDMSDNKSVLSAASLSTSSSSSSLRHLRRPRPMRSVRLAVREARDGLLEALASTGGCITPESEKFHQCLAVLEEHGNYKFASEEGMWLSLTAPNYFGSLGDNDASDPRYTLGRMAFDMFSPTSLICSLQGNFNSVERVSDEERAAMLLHVPKALQDEVMANTTVLRTYNVVAAFTIEPPSEEFPDAPNRDVQRPIKGIMTTYGYTLPDPNVPHRLSIWITGGRIEPNGSPDDVESWKRQFELHPAVHSLGEKAKLLAVKMLMGAHLHPMEADGSMEYTFTRPLGGHGIAFVDTLYCDKSLRIVRGHRGTNFVFTRIPDAPTQ